jgi:hypothetical protein
MMHHSTCQLHQDQPAKLCAQVLFEAEGCSDGDEPRVVYHNIEKSGVVGAPEELVLTAGDLNSKLYRTMET